MFPARAALPHLCWRKILVSNHLFLLKRTVTDSVFRWSRNFSDVDANLDLFSVVYIERSRQDDVSMMTQLRSTPKNTSNEGSSKVIIIIDVRTVITSSHGGRFAQLPARDAKQHHATAARFPKKACHASLSYGGERRVP